MILKKNLLPIINTTGIAKVIVVATQKGGSAKTTSTCNLAVAMAERTGKRVAIIDFDPQGHVSTTFGYDKTAYKSTIYDVLIGDQPLSSIRVKTKYGVDIYPSNRELANIEHEIILNRIMFPRDKFVLRNVIDDIKHRYDYIFIDTPPSLSLITLNALVAADEILIPVQMEPLGADGLVELLETISSIVRQYNPDIVIKGVIGTMLDRRAKSMVTQLVQDINMFCDKNKIHICETFVRRAPRMSYIGGIPVILGDRKCEAVMDYKKILEELFCYE